MDKISLYRKYRPDNFENLVGQEHVKTTLINAFQNDHIAHAYLFTGPRGTGKTSSARLIAKSLNCLNLKDKYEPCNECEFCKDIKSGRLIDLIEIDAASNRGIDEVRDLKEKINFAPSRSKYKVYIIDEVHMMTKEAFNALLKTLEEPPAHAYFILATTEIHKIPETIISRCQRFDFRRIDEETLKNRLKYIADKESLKIEEKALNAISSYVDGGLRDAIGLLEQLNIDNEIKYENVQKLLGMSESNLLLNLLEAIRHSSTEKALDIISSVYSQGADTKQFMHDFIELLRKKMLENVKKDNLNAVAKLIKIIEIFQTASSDINFSIPQLSLEIAVIKCCNDLSIFKPDSSPSNVVATVNKEKKAPEAQDSNPEELVATVPKVKKAPEAIVNKSDTIVDSKKKTDLTMESLKEKWAMILDRIKKPSLRHSIKNGIPLSFENNKLTLQFNANFHKDKVMEHENSSEFEILLNEYFNQSVKLEGIVKELEMNTVVEEEIHEAAPISSNNTGIDQALEIFGGELMD